MTTVDFAAIRSLLRDGDHARLIEFIEALPPSAADNPQVRLAFGLALLRLNRHGEALAAARDLLQRDPALADARTLASASLRLLGRASAAAAVLRSGLLLLPGHATMWRLLAEVQDELPDAGSARLRLLARTNAAAPGEPRIRRLYAQALAQASGEVRFGLAPEHALAVADRAIATDPGCGEAWSARLFARQCLDTEPSESMLQDAVAAAAAHAAGVVPRVWPARRPSAPLRVGLLASGLHTSSVRHFLSGLFARHDRDAIAIRLYDHVPTDDNSYRALTGRIEVTDVAALSNPDLADRIAGDSLDILVDLIGHGRYGRRLEVMARRPAPVQIAYCGYLGTSGLKTVDWFFSDTAIHPPGDRERYVERLLRLPNWICYQAPDWSPPIVERPTGGPVVFGSFNQLGKVSPACLDAWRAVLDAVPGSRLLVKRHDLRGHTNDFRERLREHGLPVERVDLDAGADHHRDHMSAYSRVDIALDTFPYSGATTVCEALWMGVPVVGLSGATAVSRMSRCILRAAGLEHWASDSVESMVAIARRLAEDSAGRRRFRAGARAQLATTPLCDAVAFSRSFEAACRTAAGG